MNPQSVPDLHHKLDVFWIQTNLGFLLRYWHTATEALRRVAADPNGIAEFEGNELGVPYVEAVVEGHLDRHNNAGVLLVYAIFDEFMTVLTAKLGKTRNAAIVPGDLSDRGVRRYKKFIHQVCGVSDRELPSDWQFLEDLSVVRNALIHANGNRTLVSKKAELDQAVRRHPALLSYKHGSQLLISNDYVFSAVAEVRKTALRLCRLAHAGPA